MPNEFEPSALSSSLTTLWLSFKLVTFLHVSHGAQSGLSVVMLGRLILNLATLAHSSVVWTSRGQPVVEDLHFLGQVPHPEFIERHWASLSLSSAQCEQSQWTLTCRYSCSQSCPLLLDQTHNTALTSISPLVSISPHRLHLALFSRLPPNSHVITVGSDDVTCHIV